MLDTCEDIARSSQQRLLANKVARLLDTCAQDLATSKANAKGAIETHVRHMPHQLPSVTPWDNRRIHWPVWNQNKTNTASKKMDTYHIILASEHWHMPAKIVTLAWLNPGELASEIVLPDCFSFVKCLSAQDDFKTTENSNRIRADSRHHDKCFSSPRFLQSSYRRSCWSSCHLLDRPCSGRASQTWVYTWKHFCRDIKQFQL